MLILKSLKIRPKKVISLVTLISFIVTSSFTFSVEASNNNDIIYPLKQISKLKCRFEDFDTLSSDCKRDLPILKTKDYNKYIKENWGYNEFTRIYTVLWGSSYKYGWDKGYGGHTGVDIATAKWTPVYNIAEWTVIVAKTDPSRGKVVSIKHTIKWKEITSNYAHLSKINVKKWQKVKVGLKIWEVGSTGNSTGNHLHFQLDLKYSFHPYYYSWKACPYSYYKITESGICFDELATYTLDPLEFLENKGAILDKLVINKVNSQKINTTSKEVTSNKSNTTSNIVKGFDMNIFNKTVHNELNSSIWDVKAVQTIYKDLGYYKGSINWRYQDVEKALIEFQLKNWIIKTKNENWAGWFGPKTRAHTKSAYIKYLSTSNSQKREEKWEKVYIWYDKEKNNVTVKRNIVKIERKNILTREEIEAREIDDFIKNNEINFKLNKSWWNIKVWESLKMELDIQKIINRKKRRAFKWMLPSGITFELDEKTISVFPKKITYISNWKREISLKWLKSGNTTLKIKLWNKVIKTIKLKVYWNISKIFPKTVKLIWSSTIRMWETKTAIWLFRDSANKNMIRLPFNGTFILNTWDYSKVCIKKGSLKNIKKIYTKECRDSDFVKNPEISYKDTVDWILIFDYKATSKKYSIIKIVGKNSWNIYASKKISVNIPKWLTPKYEYYNETVDMLEKGILSWTKKWYFMEKNTLNTKDALAWIENTLIEIKSKTKNSNTKAQISKKLIEIKRDKDRNSYKIITRKNFLEKSYKYLVINDNNVGISINYKDLQDIDNKKANTIFDKNNTWKDKFGDTHFRPNEKITRWEWAYMLSKALNKTSKLYLTLK